MALKEMFSSGPSRRFWSHAKCLELKQDGTFVDGITQAKGNWEIQPQNYKLILRDTMAIVKYKDVIIEERIRTYSIIK